MRTIVLGILILGAAIMAVLPTPAWSALDYGTELKIVWDTDPGAYKMLRTNWSKNGSWIVFEFRPSGKYDIMMVSPEGGRPVNLSDGSADWFMSPRFSQNDTAVLYTRFAKSPDMLLTPSLETVDINSLARETQVRNAFGGSFNWNGGFLAFIKTATPDNGFEFTVLDMGDGSTVLSGNYGMQFDFVDCCFHPSGKWVATSFNGSGGYKLYKVPMDGGAPVRIVSGGAGEEWYPSFSPKGTRLLYTQFIYSADRKTFARQVYVADVATGAAVPLIPGATMETHSACYSPDGKKVCYILETETGPKLYLAAVEPEKEDNSQLGVAVEQPVGFRLSGNYPNPFNPSTTIAFTLPSAGSARLSVYSLSGQKIRELASGEMTAGSHSVVWDGRDARGAQVSSGVYIVSLKHGSFTASKKITLVR